MSIDRLVKLLTRYRLPVEPEAVLQEAIAMILRDNAIPFVREVKLTEHDRIDFLVGTVGIECKVAGSALALARQIARYESAPELSGLLIVVTRKRLTAIARWIPGTFEKRVDVLLTRS